MSDKQPYKVLKPIGEDGRKERGEIVYLTKERANAIGAEYVVPCEPTAIEQKNSDVQENEARAELSVPELRKLCEKNGLVKTGTKSDLLARLQEAGL